MTGFSDAERQYLRLLDEIGIEEIRKSGMITDNYINVLITRIEKKPEQMRKDLELYDRVKEKYPDLGKQTSKGFSQNNNE